MVDPLPQRSQLWQFRDVYVQLDREQLYLGELPGQLRAIPFSQLRDWAFDQQEARFLLTDPQGQTQERVLRGPSQDLQALASAFNAYRAASITPANLRLCNHCDAYIDVSPSHSAPIAYCPECHCMGDTHGRNWSVLGKYAYQFCANGYFAIVDKTSVIGSSDFVLGTASLRQRVVPILTRMLGLLLWISVFTLLLFVASSSLGRVAALVLMGIIVTALLILGSHWSDLMMHGRLKPLLLPPLWEKLNSLLRRGQSEAAERLLEQAELAKHPGLLASCALAAFRDGRTETAWQHLDQALATCGNHPFLLRLACEYAPEGERLAWETRLEQVIRANRLETV